jgi:hypothetical protein
MSMLASLVAIMGGGWSAHAALPEPAYLVSGAPGCGPLMQGCLDVADVWVVASNFGILGLPEQTFDNPFGETCGHPGFVSLRYAGEGAKEVEDTYEYLFQGALWVGAIVGDDTLVSVGHDGWPMSSSSSRART